MTFLKKPQHNRFSIVFLPGYGFKCNLWQSIADQLPNYDCYLPELPDISNTDSLDAIVEKISAKIPENSVLVAWSLGGLIAIQLADHYPKKCAKLILVSSTPKFLMTDHWIGINETYIHDFYATAHDSLNTLLKKFASLVAYPQSQTILIRLKPYLMNTTDHTNTLLRYLDILITADLRTIYLNLTIPILNIHGALDAILPVDVTQQFSNPIIMKGAGHAPFVSHADEFLQSLVSFIER